MPVGKPSSIRSRPDAAEQKKIKSLEERMKSARSSGNDQQADRLMDQIQNLAADSYEKRKAAGYKRGGKVNRSNMNMQVTRGDKMDDENKEGSKKKMARGGMAKKKMARGGAVEDKKKKMARGGMAKKKMARGGKVKGSGCATKGTSKAKIR